MIDKKMTAILMPGGRQTVITTKEIPVPGPNQALLKNRAAGLCGSDLHLFYRPEPKDRDGYVFGLKLNSKIIPGHEGAGDITQIGNKVNHLKVGDRVAINHISGCGSCISCRRGWDLHCKNKTTYALDRDGFLADYTLVEARDCVSLPSNITYEEGAFWACGAGTAWSAINRLGLKLGESIAIVGLGPVGIAAVRIAMALGLTVYGFDPIKDRRDFGIEMGAKNCFDPLDATSISKMVESCEGSVEVSGTSAGRNLTLEVLKVWGKAAFVGFADDATSFDVHMQIIEKQTQIFGVWLFTTPDLQEFINRASEMKISLTEIINFRYPISDGKNAVKQFDAGSIGKTMITW
jgi:L-iditol 2-dehydrogenase